MRHLFAAILMTGLCGSVYAQGKKAAATKSDTITGEVVDVTCYANHGAKGDKHASCATKCLSAGMPAGILANGKLYIATMKDHTAPSAKLAAWAGKEVTATGSAIEKDGTHIFEIDTVEPAKK